MTFTTGARTTECIIHITQAAYDINEIILPAIAEVLGGPLDAPHVWEMHWEESTTGELTLVVGIDGYYQGTKKTCYAEWVPASDPFKFVDFWVEDYTEVWGS